ncbi:MAG: YbjQ family protein [archaeon GBS-70-058]|nr:YbjQ family protein [Candidatus Culexarchaeum nevadense]
MSSSFDDVFNKLLNIYSTRYPHNPSGTLNFHINKLCAEKGVGRVEAFIRIAYQNGIKVDEVEKIVSSGKSLDEAMRIASSNLSWWDKLIDEALRVAAPSKSPEELELEEFLKSCEAKMRGILLSTTPTIPGYRIVEVLGPVYGLTIRSRGLGGRLAASLEALVGGELTTLTHEFEKARAEALLRLVDKARRLGANAVIGLDFETSDLFAGIAIAFSVYGTAVKVEKEK